MAFDVQIVPSALDELKAIKPFLRRRIAETIEEQLQHQPTTPTRHRKILEVSSANFAFDPPLWELRIGEIRVFYDVDAATSSVFVRSIREKPPHVASEEIL